MKREFNKYLKTLSEKELVKEIQKLYAKFEPVRQFYKIELSGDTTALVATYKAKMKKEYFPSRGYGKARSSVSRKIFSDFKKVSIFQKDVIDLLLYRVEMMLDFTLAYGDIDEPYYNTLEKSFDNACELIKKEQLESFFKTYCKELVNKSSVFGWGVYDGMTYTYMNCFGEHP